MTVYTTLNKISAFEPPKSLWEKLLSSLGKTQADDEPLALVVILESNGLRDALWCTFTVFDQHREKIIQFAILYAENELLIFEKEFPNEKRPRLAIQAAKDYLAGKITETDLDSAADAAHKATYPKQGKNAAWVVVYATYAAAHAIYWWDAALDMVLGAAAHNAFWVDAEKKFQEKLFREIFGQKETIMNHQNAEERLEFALREQANLRTELERAKALLGRLVQASRRTCDSGDAWLAAHDYLYLPKVKFPFANDDEGRI